jgi:uncharacterized protein
VVQGKPGRSQNQRVEKTGYFPEPTDVSCNERPYKKMNKEKEQSYPPFRKGQGGANWHKKSGDHQKQYKRFLEKADKKAVLKKLPALHEKAFSKVDCLQCANCCKNYSPRFKTPDIKRISRHLKLKEGEFIEKYLSLDEEGDYVANMLPCPFLEANLHCGIYEVRPSDCVRFPYTDEDVILKRPRITLKNSSFCPIVYDVLESLLNE